LSLYEQYLAHVRRWSSDYHFSFADIENMPLEILLDLELVDSKIEAAFEDKRSAGKSKREKRHVFIDEIL